MKKLFVILTAILILPFSVKALDNDFTTSFDENECKLTVSGTQTGHEATVSVFNNNELKGFKTDTIKNSNFEVEFVLTYDEPTKIDITVANEDGNNEINKTNIEIPACQLTNNGKIDELFDNQGNSIKIKNKNVGFEQDDYFDLKILSEDDILEVLDEATGTTDYDTIKGLYDKLKEAPGEGNTFLYYIEAMVRDNHDNRIDYSNYNDGFVLNLNYKKEEYNKLKGLKLALLDEDTLEFVKDIEYEYNATKEQFIINVDKPCILIAYLDNTPEESNNPNTGDNIGKYILLFTISTLGLLGVGIYTKKKIFN